ncbi:MAG: hypothetical protein ACKVI4_17860, partial [Actinomycetales bacterium]
MAICAHVGLGLLEPERALLHVELGVLLLRGAVLVLAVALLLLLLAAALHGPLDLVGRRAERVQRRRQRRLQVDDLRREQLLDLLRRRERRRLQLELRRLLARLAVLAVLGVQQVVRLGQHLVDRLGQLRHRRVEPADAVTCSATGLTLGMGERAGA